MVLPILGALAGGVLSGIFGSRGASKAADSQKDAAEAQMALSKSIFDKQDKTAKFHLQRNERDIKAGRKDALSAAGKANATAVAQAKKLQASGLATAAHTRAANHTDARRIVNSNLDSLQYARDKNLNTLQSSREASLAPFANAIGKGNTALDAFSSVMGLGPSNGYDLSMTPGARFAMNEARTAVEGSAAGQGNLHSGATLQALQDRSQGVAAQDRDTQLAQLMQLAGLGQSAAGASADIRGNYANAITGQRNNYAGSANAERNNYGNVARGIRDTYTANSYGINSDARNALTDAANLYGSRSIDATNNYTANLGAARANRQNIGGQAAAQYGAAGNDAYANMGNAGAAGAIGSSNALLGGLNNGLNLYAMNGGFTGNGTGQAAGQPLSANPWLSQASNGGGGLGGILGNMFKGIGGY